MLVHYQDVLVAVFNYIALLRSSPIEAYHFEEMHALSKLTFRFREKVQPQTYAKTLSHDLLEPWPPEHLLSGWAVTREWDEALVRATLELLRPELGRITLEARDHPEEVVGDATWETERWYRAEYCARRLDPAFLEKVSLAQIAGVFNSYSLFGVASNGEREFGLIPPETEPIYPTESDRR